MKNWSSILSIAFSLLVVGLVVFSISTAEVPTYTAGNYDLGTTLASNGGSNGGAVSLSYSAPVSYGSNGAAVVQTAPYSSPTASYGSNGGVPTAPVPYAEPVASYGSNGGTTAGIKSYGTRNPLLEGIKDRRANRLQERAARVKTFGSRVGYGSTGG